MEASTSDREALKGPVEQLKGVGEAKAEELSKLNINTVEDLLFYFPYRYEDRRLRDLADAEHEETITVEGTVHSAANVRFYGRKKSRLSCKVQVDRYLITAVLFNQHFAKKHI
jgi:ATP-dependent DNA helicase RecG